MIRTTKYYTVLQGTSKCYAVLQDTTKFYSVLHSTTKYYRVHQSTTPYYKVLLRTRKYYSVNMRKRVPEVPLRFYQSSAQPPRRTPFLPDAWRSCQQRVLSAKNQTHAIRQTQERIDMTKQSRLTTDLAWNISGDRKPLGACNSLLCAFLHLLYTAATTRQEISRNKNLEARKQNAPGIDIHTG